MPSACLQQQWHGLSLRVCNEITTKMALHSTGSCTALKVQQIRSPPITLHCTVYCTTQDVRLYSLRNHQGFSSLEASRIVRVCNLLSVGRLCLEQVWSAGAAAALCAGCQAAAAGAAVKRPLRVLWTPSVSLRGVPPHCSVLSRCRASPRPCHTNPPGRDASPCKGPQRPERRILDTCANGRPAQVLSCAFG